MILKKITYGYDPLLARLDELYVTSFPAVARVATERLRAEGEACRFMSASAPAPASTTEGCIMMLQISASDMPRSGRMGPVSEISSGPGRDSRTRRGQEKA